MTPTTIDRCGNGTGRSTDHGVFAEALLSDHHSAHEHGACHGDCPWCREEQYDLGGEG